MLRPGKAEAVEIAAESTVRLAEEAVSAVAETMTKAALMLSFPCKSEIFSIVQTAARQSETYAQDFSASRFRSPEDSVSAAEAEDRLETGELNLKWNLVFKENSVLFFFLKHHFRDFSVFINGKSPEHQTRGRFNTVTINPIFT